MILIPPTHGRAGVRQTVARGLLGGGAEKRLRERMLDEMNRLYQEEFGADVPEAWLSWESTPHDPTYEMEFRLLAEAPTRATTFIDARRGTARTVQISVTTRSKIPIDPTSYRYEDSNPFRRDDHVLTFQGWDAETGLMVFDR